MNRINGRNGDRVQASGVTNTYRIGTDQSQMQLGSSTYDAAGRMVSSRDALGNETTYSETIDGNGHTIRTNTFADVGTRIEEYYPDGTLYKLTGTSVAPVKYVYDAKQITDYDGTNLNTRFTKVISLDANGTETEEFTITYTDMLGRPVRTEYADAAESQSMYNDNGQLVESLDPDDITTLYAYNGRGEQELTAIDIDQDGILDEDGFDRITKVERAVVSDGSNTVQRTTTSA